MINGGLDTKFNSDPYDVNLFGLLPPKAYETVVEGLNDSLKEARSKKLDIALFSLGSAILPLIPWAFRHHNQRKLHKKILKREIRTFNESNPGLLMRWNKRPESTLTIETRKEIHVVGTKATGGGGGGYSPERGSVGSVDSVGSGMDLRPLKGSKTE